MKECSDRGKRKSVVSQDNGPGFHVPLESESVTAGVVEIMTGFINIELCGLRGRWPVFLEHRDKSM